MPSVTVTANNAINIKGTDSVTVKAANAVTTAPVTFVITEKYITGNLVKTSKRMFVNKYIMVVCCVV
jgi:hypothetical protein